MKAAFNVPKITLLNLPGRHNHQWHHQFLSPRSSTESSRLSNYTASNVSCLLHTENRRHHSNLYFNHTCSPNLGTNVINENTSGRPMPCIVYHASVRTLASLVPKKTHYEVLGLAPSASPVEIRQAFLKLSKQCHPDSSKTSLNNHENFVQVNEAYSVLSKPSLRKQYDLTLYSEAFHTSMPEVESYNAQFRRDEEWLKNHNQKEETKERVLVNFFTLTLCLACSTVALILHLMYELIPDARVQNLSKDLANHDIEKHDLIMTSQHEGQTVYYFAVPSSSNPENYEVMAVKRNYVKETDSHEFQKLNNVNHVKEG